jgi:putative phosphoesterase
MRVAALYDIHGNLPALEAALIDVRRCGAEHLVIGGDVLPGPLANECLALLSKVELPKTFIQGNGDREVLQARAGTMSPVIPEFFREAMNWNASQLRDADAEHIAGWPLTRRLQIDGLGDVLFCHATPRNDTEIFVVSTSDDKLRPIFDPLGADLVICGHTHMQFDRTIGRTRVVNAGSIGMPFQAPAAYWVLLDGGVELRATQYDLPAAAGRVRESRYPLADNFATANILTAPDTAAMVEAMAKGELA